MDWLALKGYVSQLTVSKDALHIYAALIIQIAAASMARKSLASLVPWSAVLVIELVNEALDLLFEKEPYIHRWQIEGSIHDVINTMLLPTLLLLLVRHVPRLFQPSTGKVPEPSDPTSRHD